MQVNKKVWFVTGGGSGLGRSIVEAALKAGENVVATARNIGQLNDLSRDFGDQLLITPLDVTNEQQIKYAVSLALEKFGKIDVLVNNAGYGDTNPFEQVAPEDFRKLMETCFFGPVNLTRQVLPSMRKNRSGHIIQISSAGGRLALAGNAAYHSAKWALGGFSESLAQETKGFNVKVTALEPGGIRTNWGKRAFGDTPSLLPEYESTVGALMKAHENYWGNENSDPDKVAQIVLMVSRTEELPPHILVGSDAYHFVKLTSEKRWEDAEKWLQITKSADIDNQTILPEHLEK